MSQGLNNLVMTGLMLLIAASIVFSYNEFIDYKIDKAHSQQLQLKWFCDGSGEVLMQKQSNEWVVVPKEVSSTKRYYPVESIE